MHPVLMSIARTIYPIQDSHLRRDRELEVLALGLSRSGTDSLRHALLELGYNDVHHGFRMGEHSEEALQWIRLSRAHLLGDNNFLTAEQFDRNIGDCSAITDIPCAGFADRLVELYPKAKIILNYREDVDAWHTSAMNSIEKIVKGQSWYDYILTWFQPELFWRQRRHWYVWYRFVNDDFPANGKAWYRKHYQHLEAQLPKDRYLKWKVEDGWEPLCKYLGKPVPQHPFPQGNVPEAFMKRAIAYQVQWKAEAERNLKRVSLGMASVAAVAGAVWFYRR